MKKSPFSIKMGVIALAISATGGAFLFLCLKSEPSGRDRAARCEPANAGVATIVTTSAINPLSIILVPQTGVTPLDKGIRAMQDKIRHLDSASPLSKPLINKLGWLFISKARVATDPGYYKLAEQCAAAIGGYDSDSLLLTGHIAHAMHRFHDAEVIARKLVAMPEANWQDFALLGDALMEQGSLDSAIGSYQQMIDLKPCLQTYSRVAHVRWLKGDLIGAIEMMRVAVEAGNSRDPEPGAWAYTRLAVYQFQSGDETAANWSVNRALQLVKNYPAALLLKGKMLMAQGKPLEALESLKTAARENPLPEYEWTLAEAASVAGRNSEAAEAESFLQNRAAADDPRTYSLFLSSRSKETELALKLAQAELENRRDVFTYDSLAWASLAAGKIQDAKAAMTKALSEGTVDARLFYHAGMISMAAGDHDSAREWLKKATAIQRMLLPSERSGLQRQIALQSLTPGDANPLSQVTSK